MLLMHLKSEQFRPHLMIFATIIIACGKVKQLAAPTPAQTSVLREIMKRGILYAFEHIM